MSEHLDRIQQIDKLVAEEISPTFCLAKWHHTTIYLHRGQTHSCYHPKPHDSPLAELKYTPSALHNTPQKIDERVEMLNGDKPTGCQYCWNVESMDDENTPAQDRHISDRQIRNSSIYTEERFQEIVNNAPDYKINPEYIEIAFSNECNFKCGYCHPMHSSSFYNEIKKHGPYTTVDNHSCDIDWFTSYEDEETNPYVDAWWRWWPEVSKTLNILRITGGEPLLHKTTWKLFDELRFDPKPNLEINVNSNLGMTKRHVEKLVENVTDLLENNKIRQFKMFTSVDTWGKRAEYLRTGLDIEKWEKNQDIYVRGVKSHITHMVTFNILSVSSFKTYLEKLLEWRELYDDIIPNDLGSDPSVRKIRFDTPYLKEPIQYDMHLLPKDIYMRHFDECLDFIKDNIVEEDTKKFSQIEYERFRRVRDYFATTQYDQERIDQGRKDFYNWFTEYDKRRGTNFLEVFPDMEDFWNLCKATAEQFINVVQVQE
jgi:pyruvate-formate lyase-activating enzyme